jgi:saccharopine dehydrogenase-like NADP-dependent oxidoreductase
LSYCGGLPAPECSDNPLGYKFSWSSRGVLLALLNNASFYDNNQVVSVTGNELMAHAKPYYITPAFAFVAYPNRDSTPFKEWYGIPEAETVVRGTLRYQGFPEFIKALVDTGARKRVEDVDPSGQRCLIENCGKDTLKLTYVFPRENVPDRFLVSRAHKVVFSLVVLA